MAIDPSISLQAAPTKGIGLDWSSINDTRNTTQSIANQQAALPGIQAQSDMQQRQNAAQNWMQNSASQFVNDDGSFNVPKAATAASIAGFPDYANGMLAHFVTTDIQQTKDANDRLDLANKTLTGQAAILSALPSGPINGADLNLNQTAKKQSDFLDTAGYAPNSGTKLGAAVGSQFWARDGSGNPILDANGNPAIDSVKVNAVKQASIPADVQEGIRNTQLANHTSADAMNVNSGLSRATNSLAVKLGFAKDTDPPQSDFYWTTQRPDFAAAIKNSIPSGSYVEQQRNNALNYGAAAKTYQAAIDAAPAGYQNNDLWRGATKLGAFLKTVQNDPQWAGFISMLQNAKKYDPTIDENTMSGDAIMNKLNKGLNYSNSLNQYYGDAAQSGVKPIVDQTGTPGAGNPTPNLGVPNTPKVTSGPAQALPAQDNTFQPVKNNQSSPNATMTPQANTGPGSKGVVPKARVQSIMADKGLPYSVVVNRLHAAGYKVEGE